MKLHDAHINLTVLKLYSVYLGKFETRHNNFKLSFTLQQTLKKKICRQLKVNNIEFNRNEISTFEEYECL